MLNTRYFAQAQDNVDAIVHHRRLSLFYGIPGAGKSVAAQAACDRYEGYGCYLEIDASPNPKSIANDMLQAITGVPHQETRFKARQQLVEHLADEPRFLILDEIHLSRSVENIDFVRVLHMRVGVPILLVGDHRVRERLGRSPQIVRRIRRPTFFQALSSDDVLTTIPHFHPIYAEADPDLIARLDQRFCEGNLGNWSKLTEDAADACAQQGEKTITGQIAAQALSLQGDWRI